MIGSGEQQAASRCWISVWRNSPQPRLEATRARSCPRRWQRVRVASSARSRIWHPSRPRANRSTHGRAVAHLRECEGHRLFLGCTTSHQFPPAIIEMLRELVDDLALARRRQAERRQVWANVLFPVRHVSLAWPNGRPRRTRPRSGAVATAVTGGPAPVARGGPGQRFKALPLVAAACARSQRFASAANRMTLEMSPSADVSESFSVVRLAQVHPDALDRLVREPS